MLDVSQSAQSVSRPLEYPLEHPPEYRNEYSIKDRIFEGLGAGAPFGAGADESASLRLIKTGRLPICKRHAQYTKQVIHIEWLIPT